MLPFKDTAQLTVKRSMRRLILLFLCVTTLTHAQTDEALKKERADWLLQKQKNDEWDSGIQKSLTAGELELKASLIERDKLDDLVKNKQANINKAIQEATDALDSLSTADRTF